MKYISKEQLDIEIEEPLVKNIKQGSIQKFIDSTNYVQISKREDLKATRPITTKAFLYETSYFQT